MTQTRKESDWTGLSSCQHRGQVREPLNVCQCVSASTRLTARLGEAIRIAGGGVDCSILFEDYQATPGIRSINSKSHYVPGLPLTV